MKGGVTITYRGTCTYTQLVGSTLCLHKGARVVDMCTLKNLSQGDGAQKE